MSEEVPPQSLAALADRVEKRIDTFLEEEQRRWETVDPALGEAVSSLRAVIGAGGKRLRPAFCHWGFVAAGGDPSDPAVTDAGAALELLHTCAVVHDDIIDGGTFRHGRPCLHVEYAERHQQQGGRGEARRFGEGAALLVGDLALVYGDTLISGVNRSALGVYNDLRIEVNMGQFLDLTTTASGNASLARAHAICVYKSGKYTVERPLHLGAGLTGRLDELCRPLSAFGLPLGEAFQLRDDLLGAFGDGQLLGKGVGEDFREAKPTALFAAALERANDSERGTLDRLYGVPELTHGEVAELQELLVRTGARAYVEARIHALLEESRVALEVAPITEQARRELGELATYVVGRDR